MKKIKLKGVLATLSDVELKNVRGGGTTDYRMVMPDDMIVDAEGENPCEKKQEGDPCSFINDRGVTQHGKCRGVMSLHCSDLS
jgi:hypothetical protein